jgi:sec-independent protein translocase protein TatB
MFDLGWSEMAVILLVALIVIGPKDLPRVARTIGKWTGKARAMAREFHRSLDDMAREADLQDIKAEMDKLSRVDMRQRIEETIDPEGELRRSLTAPIDLDPDDDDMREPDDPPPPAKLPPPPAPAVAALVKAPAPPVPSEAAPPPGGGERH